MKEDIPKYFGHMVTTAIKPLVFENMSEFQIGGVPGHRAQEHLFTVKSVLALAEKNNAAMAIQVLDLSKYFDSESLLDCLNEIYRAEVKGNSIDSFMK